MAATDPGSRSSSPSPEPDPTRRKKKAGRKSPFDAKQEALITSKFAEYEELLIEHKLQYGKDARRNDTPTAVKTWVSKTVGELLKRKEFVGLSKADKSEKEWQTVDPVYSPGATVLTMFQCLFTKFKNQRYNAIVPKHRQALIEQALRQVEQGCEDKWMNVKQAFKVITAFQRGPLTAKEIFVKENQEIIDTLTDSLVKSDPSVKGNGGGAHAKAVTQLWSQANHEEYEAKAKDQFGGGKIFENQRAFARGLFTTLSEIAQNGVLGNVEVCVWLGSRDSDDEISASYIEISSEPGSDKFIKDDASGMTKELGEAWSQWLENKIKPNKPSPQLDQRIPINTAGIPTLSNWNSEQVTMEGVREVLENYLANLWYRASKQYTVPYEDIARDPSSFYDTEAFPLPVALASPRALDWVQLYSLLNFFTKVDPLKPFVFRPRSDNLDDAHPTPDQSTTEQPSQCHDPVASQSAQQPEEARVEVSITEPSHDCRQEEVLQGVVVPDTEPDPTAVPPPVNSHLEIPVPLVQADVLIAQVATDSQSTNQLNRDSVEARTLPPVNGKKNPNNHRRSTELIQLWDKSATTNRSTSKAKKASNDSRTKGKPLSNKRKRLAQDAGSEPSEPNKKWKGYALIPVTGSPVKGSLEVQPVVDITEGRQTRSRGQKNQ
ncbi:hypothetical protein PQX77_020569 [Marasmius sp. AFHP31]|nr:hypothetical protein PQX77_020569 [Marasmius sp. AFHP31]